VPDAVLVGGLAGRDRGPDDGAEQRRRAAQPAVGALLAELREVGELAFRHQQVDRLRVHPVEGEDDHAPADSAALAGQEDDGEGKEDGSARGDDGEARAAGNGHPRQFLLAARASQAC
jgi:hypothetical protein